MITVVCDSACDLWKDQIKELKVQVLKFPYLIDGEEQEKQLVEPEEFDEYYAKLKKGAMPSTSLINEFVLEEYFEDLLKKGSDILFIHFSSALTSTFNSFPALVDRLLLKYPERKFLVCDTLGVTMQTGILVYDAVKKLNKGESLEDVYKYLEDMKQRVACYFGVDDLFFLKRGGRVSAATAIAGTLLGIKPVLQCNEEGKIENLPFNRALYTTDGEIYDIIAGSFFICSAPSDSENFESIEDEKLPFLMQRFKAIEYYI